MTQSESLLSYLMQGNDITPLEALNKFGCFRLGARMWDLRHEGYDIRSRIVDINGKHVAQYYLYSEKQLEMAI